MSIHLVYAPPKKGKTCYLVYQYLLALNDKERTKNARDILCNKMQNIPSLSSYLDLSHYVFVNQQFIKRMNMHTPILSNVINPFEFALPNAKFSTVFIPEYSTIIIDEAQKYYNSRKEVSSFVCNAFEMSGHSHYEIWLGTQRPKMIDLRIRELIVDFKYIDNVEFVTTKDGIKTIIYTIEHDNCYAVEEFIKSGYKTPEGVKKVYEINVDLRNCYDAFCYREAFYNGLTSNKDNLNVRCLSQQDSNKVLTSDYIVPKGFFED